MMVSRYDESRLLIVLQIDHSRVGDYLLSIGATKIKTTRFDGLAAQEHDSDGGLGFTLDARYPPDYLALRKPGKGSAGFLP
jgi:hypothetical protein